MAYGRKYKKRRFTKKRTYRRRRRGGFRRKDYTPVIKVEQYYVCQNVVYQTSASATGNIMFKTVNNGSESLNYISYASILTDDSGTFSKYKNNYGTYKITGCAVEWTWAKDMTTLENQIFKNGLPFIGMCHYPAEPSGFIPSPVSMRQQDQFQQIQPKTGKYTSYQRFPNGYINNTLSNVGVGTWNTMTNITAQLGGVAIANVTGVIPPSVQDGGPTLQITFAYVKVNLYIKFGSKKI